MKIKEILPEYNRKKSNNDFYDKLDNPLLSVNNIMKLAEHLYGKEMLSKSTKEKSKELS